jgi:hypothetical protein
MEDDPVAYLSEKKYRSFKEAGNATSFAYIIILIFGALQLTISFYLNQYLDSTIKTINQVTEKDNIIFQNF